MTSCCNIASGPLLKFTGCILPFDWTDARRSSPAAPAVSEPPLAAPCRLPAAITIVDIDQGAAQALAQELPHSSILIFDITDEAAVKQAFLSLGSLDILINNAGIGLVGA
jgi:hypothetical protein